MIEIVDLKQDSVQDICRVMVCQLNSELFDWDKKSNLHYLKYNDKILLKINELLSISKQYNVDLITFPELGIPLEFLEKLQLWSKQNELIIFAGSHYYEIGKKIINRAPIIIDGEIFFSEKTSLSPLEKSPILGMGASEGEKILLFKNTRIGNILNLICADYLDDKIKTQINEKDDLDILNVSCFQRDSEVYYRRINIDIEESTKGIYITYNNFVDKKYGDGRSALFGLMDRLFLEQLKEHKYTDLNPEKKIIEIQQENEYFICDLDLKNKRPAANRNIHTKPNVILIESSSTSASEYDFIKKIAHDDERYRRIEDLFVAPSEFNEINQLLDSSNLVFITGDPGIGKTYLAVKLLKNYYSIGYEPVWISGLDKEERDLQSKFLIDYEPNNKEIIYIEDPFGKTSFEKRDGLYQIFKPLISKLKKTNCKVIITSRKEIFEKFTKESLLDNDITDLSKELNIARPSYSKDDLLKIYLNLSSLYQINEYDSKVEKEIINGKLSTPLMIRDLVSHLKNNISENELDVEKYVNDSKNDIVKNYSYEVKDSDIEIIALLYITLFTGTKGKPFISSVFNDTILLLEKNGKTIKNKSFNICLRSQIGYRIEQFGYSKTAYKLSHPIYEESLSLLYLKNDLCENIVDTIIEVYNKIDTTISFKTINRFTSKQPELSSKLLYKYLEYNDIDNINTKSILTRKLISLYYGNNEEKYFELATDTYDFKELINDLNSNFISWQTLINQLNLCNSYYNNSPSDYNIDIIDNLNWDFIFNNKGDSSFNHSKIIYLLSICYSINPISINKFIQYKGRNLVKKVFLFSDDNDRKRLLNFTKGNSLHKELYRYRNIIEKLEVETKNKNNLFRKVLFNDYKYFGKIIIDKGASFQFRKPWINLLAAGILSIEGDFDSGQIVGVFDSNDNFLFVGMSEYSSTDLDKIKGCHSKTFYEILEYPHSKSIIRADFKKPVKYDYKKWEYIDKTATNIVLAKWRVK